MTGKNKYFLKARIGKEPLKENETDIFDIENSEGKKIGALFDGLKKENELLSGQIESLQKEIQNIKEWQNNVSKLLNLKFSESEDL